MMLRTILSFLLVFMNSYLYAGPNSSGGGMAVVCKNEDNVINSVDLLDVYEAKQNPKLRVLRPSNDLLEDYTRLTNNSFRLQGSRPGIPSYHHKEMLRHMLSLIDWHMATTPLPFLADQGASMTLPKECDLQQLAIFYDAKGRMVVDQALWLQLDTISKAALLKHESYYYYERKYNEVTSMSTRSFVRQVVSVGHTPVKQGHENANMFCMSNDGNNVHTNFYVHQYENDLGTEDVTIQLLDIAGRRMLVKSTAEFKDLIFDNKTINKSYKSKIISDHRDDWELEITMKVNQPMAIAILQDGVQITNGSLLYCDNK